MVGRLSTAALAKVKVTALAAIWVVAGGVSGALALNHVAPSSDLIRNSATTTTTDGTDGDADTADAQSTTDSTDATGSDATDTDSTDVTDPGTTDATSGDASTGYALPDCPTDVVNHGSFLSSIARLAPKGTAGEHGSWTSQAAGSDCGKPDGAAAEGTDGTDDTATAAGGADAASGHGEAKTTGRSTHDQAGRHGPGAGLGTDGVDSGEPASPTTTSGEHGHGHGHGTGGGANPTTDAGTGGHGSTDSHGHGGH